jgi:2-polyprenyl-3-methyl-5-hydroxy-6-metoxy-1,4-benzoquinol methylase
MTGKELKERGFEEVVGIELIEEIAKQGEPYYDRMFIGDVEKMELPYEKGHFDCILYPDVLEHLINPWEVLKEHNALVKKGGIIVCSIPNIRHYRVIKRLAFKGEWEYKEDGIMDKTHLRFFTLQSIRKMLIGSGFEVARVVKNPSGSSIIWSGSTLLLRSRKTRSRNDHGERCDPQPQRRETASYMP